MSAAPYTAEAIEALMVKTFHAGREARSKEYKHGCRVMLCNRLAYVPFPYPPYTIGTAASDAYYAGQDEGRNIVASERATKATGSAS